MAAWILPRLHLCNHVATMSSGLGPAAAPWGLSARDHFIYDLPDDRAHPRARARAPARGPGAYEDHRRARELSQPGDGARPSPAVAVLLPQAAEHPGGRRRPGAAPAVVRAARLRGRGRPGDR